MLFNSIEFFLFFPVALVGNYIFPKRIRYLWLLVCSYYFYMGWNPVYALLLLSSTVITYCCGRMLESIKNKPWEDSKKILHKKLWVGFSLAANLGILCYFKYMNFFIHTVTRLCETVGITPNISELNILLPVGISFYIFQALGYTIDVYRDEIYAEKNFFKYALFVSFFPQLVAGPIERSKNLLAQLKAPKGFSFDNLKQGLMLMLYGLFMKMVIADRAGVIVNTVYDNAGSYPGLYVAVATIFFAIQIYCDFYGYSTIARGAALTMGIHLIDNFNAPYFSKNIKDFWRRWHISLSGWFRDYLYIPLGGNRKGFFRKNVNLLFTFLISGLWHGAGFNFIAWGGLNGVFQVIADFRNRLWERTLKAFSLKKRERQLSAGVGIIMRIVTFLLVCFTWMFFRADNMGQAIQLIKCMTECFNWQIFTDGSIFNLGVDIYYFTVLAISILILFIVDYKKYRGKKVIEGFFAQGEWFKILSVVVLITAIVLFGCYGEMYDASEFIYFQF